MNKQSWIKILGSLFIAAILVASYAAYGASAASTTTQATTIVQNYTAYWHAVNTTSVSVENFSNVFTVTALCANQSMGASSLNYTYAQISKLSNDSVQVTQLGNELLVNSGTITSKQVYTYAESRLNESQKKCITYQMTALIKVPKQIRFKATYIFSSAVTNVATVQIPASMQSYALPIRFADNLTNSTQIKIVALMSQNYQIIGNLSVSVS